MVGVGDVVSGLADEANEAPDEGTGQDGAWFTWRGCQEMYLNGLGLGVAGKIRYLFPKQGVLHTRCKRNQAPRKSARRTTDIYLLPQRCLSVLHSPEYGCSRSYGIQSGPVSSLVRGPNIPQYDEPRSAQLNPVSAEYKPMFGDPRRMAFTPPSTTPAAPIPPYRKVSP